MGRPTGVTKATAALALLKLKNPDIRLTEIVGQECQVGSTGTRIYVLCGGLRFSVSHSQWEKWYLEYGQDRYVRLGNKIKEHIESKSKTKSKAKKV